MAERQPSQTAPQPGGDLGDHGSALRTATSALWNGTGEHSGDPMGPYHRGEPRRTAVTASQIASQYPCGAEIASKYHCGKPRWILKAVPAPES